MTDIFFSYSHLDRDRVQPIHVALAARGFDVFWDQSVPPGTDWDTWIRQHLNEAKCTIVFWSKNSVVSGNVRHEAAIAKEQGKLIPALLDVLATNQFPMGLHSVQGANLTAWRGDEQDAEWLKLQGEVDFRLTPPWVRRQIDILEAELVAERARRDTAERRNRILREQVVKEAQTQQELSRERDEALENLAVLNARVENEERNKIKPDERQRLTQELEDARQRLAASERAISEVEIARDKALEECTNLRRRLQTTEAGLRKAEARASELASLRDAQIKIEILKQDTVETVFPQWATHTAAFLRRQDQKAAMPTIAKAAEVPPATGPSASIPKFFRQPIVQKTLAAAVVVMNILGCLAIAAFIGGIGGQLFNSVAVGWTLFFGLLIILVIGSSRRRRLRPR